MVKSTLLILTLSAMVTLPAPADKAPDTMWTHKKINGKELRMSVFLPDGCGAAKTLPAIAIFHGGSWNMESFPARRRWQFQTASNDSWPATSTLAIEFRRISVGGTDDRERRPRPTSPRD